MSYYIIPKIVNKVYVSPLPINETHNHNPYLSRSLCKYFFQMKMQLMDMFAQTIDDVSWNNINEAFKLVNPYQYLYAKVPGSHLSVSKLTFKTNVFYDLLELVHTLSLLDGSIPLKTLHVTQNYTDSVGCMEIIREGMAVDIHSVLTHIGGFDNDFRELKHDLFDFVYYEADDTASFVKALVVVLLHQSVHGTTVINVNGIFDKVLVDGLFFLSSLFQKVYISKPSPNNITTFNKYIVCKDFQHRDEGYLRATVDQFLHHEEAGIGGLFEFHVPSYFRNKLDEVNVIIGQQQLDALETILSVYRNKNKHDKIENIKKSNIQKSVVWCEKFKIPCNRFSGKVNIFLPILNESD